MQIITAESWADSQSDAEERAERWEAVALSAIHRTLEKPDRFGRPRLVTVNSSSSYMIQGAAFIEPDDDELTRRHKKSRRFVSHLMRELQSLSDRSFELCCAKILHELGVTAPILTQFSADEGIDFYGSLRLEDFIHSADIEPTIQRQLVVWMIGQAKHYQKTKVATPDIRELVGSVELARARAFSSLNEAKYVDLKIKICDPIFRLFFTTGDISEDGWVLLERSGVIGMDGLMLAAFLSDRQIGCSNGEFDGAAFAEWMRSPL